MHELADCEVGHEEAVEFLDGEIGSAASQYDPGAAQVGFQFVESGFDLPALLIEGGEFVGRCGLGIEDGGDQPVERLGIFKGVTNWQWTFVTAQVVGPGETSDEAALKPSPRVLELGKVKRIRWQSFHCSPSRQ